MGRKMLLVDGHNLLFRMFFGIPARIPGKDGGSIHGVVGFIAALLKTLALHEPSHMAILFDHESGSFRSEIDDDYKGNRPTDSAGRRVDDDPFAQLAHVYHALDHIGWKHAETPCFEVDDVIAAYVRKCESQAEVIILSTDSDLLQLVKPGVSVVCPKGKNSVLYGPEEVRAKYGVMPLFIPDLKALMGDKTDNLIGIPGIGPKTAGNLIRQLGGVPEIYEGLGAIKRHAIRNLLITHQDRVMHNLSMIRLDHGTTLPFTLRELAISPRSWQHKTMEVLREAGIAISPDGHS